MITIYSNKKKKQNKNNNHNSISFTIYFFQFSSSILHRACVYSDDKANTELDYHFYREIEHFPTTPSINISFRFSYVWDNRAWNDYFRNFISQNERRCICLRVPRMGAMGRWPKQITRLEEGEFLSRALPDTFRAIE